MAATAAPAPMTHPIGMHSPRRYNSLHCLKESLHVEDVQSSGWTHAQYGKWSNDPCPSEVATCMYSTAQSFCEKVSHTFP